MFDWLFRPSCPCDPVAKAWVEDRLAWLADEFPANAFAGRPLVLPIPEHFPDPWRHDRRSARRMLDRVCGYMDVDPDRVDLELKNELRRNLDLVDGDGQALAAGAAGTYSERPFRSLIRIDVEELADPMNVVGTLAHELAHVRLLGEGRLDGEEFDNELLTDLTVVHFGLGVFLANSPRDWRSADSTWPGTTFRRPEYLSPPMFGWALAHLAWFRGEDRPDWARHLSGGARTNLREGLRYLITIGDSSYRPVGERRPPR